MRKFCGVCPVSDFTGLQAATLQAKKVTGEVTSATDGSLLIGVSVQVQGSSMGTITDLDGKYSLDVNAEKHWSSHTLASRLSLSKSVLPLQLMSYWRKIMRYLMR